MRGVTIVAAGSDPARLHAALTLAAACAARGRPARIFLQAEAVAMLREPAAPADPDYGKAGMPTLREMLGESLALGVSIIACQSGLALAGMSAEDLPAGVETGGLVDILARHRDDELVMA